MPRNVLAIAVSMLLLFLNRADDDSSGLEQIQQRPVLCLHLLPCRKPKHSDLKNSIEVYELWRAPAHNSSRTGQEIIFPNLQTKIYLVDIWISSRLLLKGTTKLYGMFDVILM